MLSWSAQLTLATGTPVVSGNDCYCPHGTFRLIICLGKAQRENRASRSWALQIHVERILLVGVLSYCTHWCRK